jgi:hypothetical protein
MPQPYIAVIAEDASETLWTTIFAAPVVVVEVPALTLWFLSTAETTNVPMKFEPGNIETKLSQLTEKSPASFGLLVGISRLQLGLSLLKFGFVTRQTAVTTLLLGTLPLVHEVVAAVCTFGIRLAVAASGHVPMGVIPSSTFRSLPGQPSGDALGKARLTSRERPQWFLADDWIHAAFWAWESSEGHMGTRV